MEARVKDEPDLIKSGPVVKNVNTDEYRSFVAKRNAMIANQRRIEALETSVNSIEAKLDSILAALASKAIK